MKQANQVSILGSTQRDSLIKAWHGRIELWRATTALLKNLNTKHHLLTIWGNSYVHDGGGCHQRMWVCLHMGVGVYQVYGVKN